MGGLRPSITLRHDGECAELVIATNGECEVIPLSAEQVRLLAEQSVALLCRHVERQGRSEAPDSVR
jgi:hypothetical protein